MNDLVKSFTEDLYVPPVPDLDKKGIFYITKKGYDQCFDAPLPCTPLSEFEKSKLVLIDSTDLKKGFRVIDN